MRRSGRLALLLFSACLLSAPAVAEEAKVRAGQTLSDLFGSKDPTAAGSSRTLPGGSDVAARLALGASGLFVAVALAVMYRRRRRLGAGAQSQGEAIEIVSRAHLSHRHAVFVLRIVGRRLVVGVSGDHMTALGELDAPAVEEAAVKQSAAADSEGRSSGSRGYSARPGDREAVSAARGIPDAELMPYRKQMDRLRGLLRGLRGDIEDGETPREAQRS